MVGLDFGEWIFAVVLEVYCITYESYFNDKMIRKIHE